jgi:hypothetical protein
MEYDKFNIDMPVKVVIGKQKGKIGYIDDEEMPFVYVHFDEFSFGYRSCERINIKNVEPIKYTDLINRIEILKSNINKEIYKKNPDYIKLFDYYQEYSYVNDLQIQFYIKASYLKPTKFK